MSSKWAQNPSDGVKEINYELGLKPIDAPKLNSLLNAAARAFHLQCGGIWNDEAMEPFCDELATLVLKNRSITNRMFRSGDPLLEQLIKRGLELLPEKLRLKNQGK